MSSFLHNRAPSTPRSTKQIKAKAKTADDQAETELANAEKTATRSEAKPSLRQRQKERAMKTSLKAGGKAFKGAISDAFDSNRDAINDFSMS